MEILFGACTRPLRQCEDAKEENADDEMKQGRAKVSERTASRKNLTSQSDDDDAASPKPNWTGTKRGKAKKTASHKKPAASDALLCCITSKGSSVQNGGRTHYNVILFNNPASW